ncbi:Uncharacterised protein [Mycobacteroides abscessus subsp. abscessus]|nr:Uncharacterised protein [Mycobacteroides abscessus subsp. abscessus]
MVGGESGEGAGWVAGEVGHGGGGGGLVAVGDLTDQDGQVRGEARGQSSVDEGGGQGGGR